MAKVNSTGRNKDRYVLLTHSMMDSPAFQSLSSNAIALFLHIQRRYNGFNNGHISLSVREAAENRGISKDTAGKAFNELTEKGFIRVAESSCFTMKQKTARRWELTNQPLKQGVAPSNDWRTWNSNKRKEAENEDQA